MHSPRVPRTSVPPPTHSFHRPLFPRQRSKSVPTVAFVNIPEVEANIIFSAAERATLRRRRPKSSYSPDYDLLQLAKSDQPTAERWHFSVQPTAPTWTPETAPSLTFDTDTSGSPSNDEAVSHPAQEEEFLLMATSDAVDVEDDSFHYTEYVDAEPLGPPSPVVHSQSLRSYAEGLLLFTRSRLRTTAPSPIIVSPANAIKSDYFDVVSSLPSPPTTPVNPTFSPQTQRPQLVSYFSDWSQTSGTDCDILSLYGSALQTPLEPAGSSSPHGPDIEATPRAPTFNFDSIRDMLDEVSDSPPAALPELHFSSSPLDFTARQSPPGRLPSYFDVIGAQSPPMESPWPLKPSFMPLPSPQSAVDRVQNSFRPSPLAGPAPASSHGRPHLETFYFQASPVGSALPSPWMVHAIG